MSERVRKKRPAPQERRTDQADIDVPGKRPEKAEVLIDEMNDLLDEIDGLLEDNAEEFVKNYVQKGGQ